MGYFFRFFPSLLNERVHFDTVAAAVFRPVQRCVGGAIGLQELVFCQSRARSKRADQTAYFVRGSEALFS
jgi:hypothetical protein